MGMLMATQGPATFYSVTIVLTVLGLVVVGLRFHARRKQRQPLKADDWLIAAAAIVTLSISAAIWAGVAEGSVGYPAPIPTTRRSLEPRTPIDQVSKLISRTEKVYFAVICLAALDLTLIKLSILAFYHRIFCSARSLADPVRLLILTMMVVVTCWGVGFGFAYAFSCGKHFRYWWASAGAELQLYCINTQQLTYGSSVSDFIIDMIIIMIPLPLVMKLHINTGKKLGVIAVFLTGALACVASAIKLAWFVWENQTPWNPSWDQNLLGCTFMFWIMAETHVGLIAACLPTLRAIVKDQSLNSVIKSIRSKISLNSVNSQRSQKSNASQRSSEDAAEVLPVHEIKEHR